MGPLGSAERHVKQCHLFGRRSLEYLHPPEQRFALDDGQLVAGISAFAVPILPPKRDAVASIAINMTSARLNPDRLRELVARLRGEIDAIERVINPLESDVTRRAMAG